MANNLPFDPHQPKRRGRKPLYPNAWGSGDVAYVGTFKVFSLDTIDRQELELGDKVILPESTLVPIRKLRLPFPLIFEMRAFKARKTRKTSSKNELMAQYKRRIEDIYRDVNPDKICNIDRWLDKHRDDPHKLYVDICNKYGIIPKPRVPKSVPTKNSEQRRPSPGVKQYCSVIEFSGQREGCCYAPLWMMQNLNLCDGDTVELESQFNIPKGTCVSFAPKSKDFLKIIEIIGAKVVFEDALVRYSVLSENERIVIEFDQSTYDCVVTKCEPKNVICIMGTTDLEVQFEPYASQSPPLRQSPHTDVPATNFSNPEQKFEQNLDTDPLLNHLQPTDSSNNNNDHLRGSDSSNNIKTSSHESEHGTTVSTEIIASQPNQSIIETNDSDHNFNIPYIKDKAALDHTFFEKLSIPLLFNEQEQLAQTLLTSTNADSNPSHTSPAAPDVEDAANTANTANTVQSVNSSAPDATDSKHADSAEPGLSGICVPCVPAPVEDEDALEAQMEHEDEDEEKAEMIDDAQVSPPGPDDVLCQNCGRWIASMSFMTHETHCARQYIRCKICKQMVRRGALESEHFESFHAPQECLCGAQLAGTLKLAAHEAQECLLRREACRYCEAEMTFVDLKGHEIECKDEVVECDTCQRKCARLELFNKLHRCGVACPLCGIFVDPKELGLHVMTQCPERRATCPYCKVLRKVGAATDEMEEHIHYCGGRTERCELCEQYCTLANMDRHVASGCEKFSNRQLARAQNKMNKSGKKGRRAGATGATGAMRAGSYANTAQDGALAGLMEGLNMEEIEANPYLESSLLQRVGLNSSRNELSSTLASFAAGTEAHSGVSAMSGLSRLLGVSPSPQGMIYCPHCYETDHFCKDSEDFQMHIVTMHPHKVDDPMTATVFEELQAVQAVQAEQQAVGEREIPEEDGNKTYSSVVGANMRHGSDLGVGEDGNKKRSDVGAEGSSKKIMDYYRHNAESSALAVVGKGSFESKEGDTKDKDERKKALDKKDKKVWICSACTLENSWTRGMCQVCREPRPPRRPQVRHGN